MDLKAARVLMQARALHRTAVEPAIARKVVGTDGFFEVRLGVDGSASAFAINT